MRFVEAILILLNLNNKELVPSASVYSSTLDGIGDPSLLSNNDSVWKVLIYDQAGQEIISPLLKVNELRENGVTVHMYDLSTLFLCLSCI
jgi:hypothetical protein